MRARCTPWRCRRICPCRAAGRIQKLRCREPSCCISCNTGSLSFFLAPSLSSLMKYSLEPFSLSGFTFSASIIALCSACMQQVLSDLKLDRSSSLMQRSGCSSRGSELKPEPIISLPLIITAPHLDRRHVDFSAISAAMSIYFFAAISCSPDRNSNQPLDDAVHDRSVSQRAIGLGINKKHYKPG